MESSYNYRLRDSSQEVEKMGTFPLICLGTTKLPLHSVPLPFFLIPDKL